MPSILTLCPQRLLQPVAAVQRIASQFHGDLGALATEKPPNRVVLFLSFAAAQGWPWAACQMCPFGQFVSGVFSNIKDTWIHILAIAEQVSSGSQKLLPWQFHRLSHQFAHHIWYSEIPENPNNYWISKGRRGGGERGGEDLTFLCPEESLNSLQWPSLPFPHNSHFMRKVGLKAFWENWALPKRTQQTLCGGVGNQIWSSRLQSSSFGPSTTLAEEISFYNIHSLF